MKNFPSWLIYLAAIGLGFFAFVITAGALPKILSFIPGGLFLMLFITLLGLAAAYFAFRYSRRFMARNISNAAGHIAGRADGANDAMSAGEARKKRIAMALFFSGTVLFPVFIFMLLSSIINLYV